MPKQLNRTENAKITDAVLSLASINGWKSVTLDAIAEKTKISLLKLKKHFSAPRETIPVVADEITLRALAAVENTSGTPRDVLLDLMMARFDILQKYRKGVISIANAARRDPLLMRIFAHTLSEGLNTMMATAKFNVLPRSMMTAGLVGVYARTYWAWQRDTTRDMSKTMAALDQALRLVEKAMDLVKRSSSRATTSKRAPAPRPRKAKRARTR